MNRFVIGIGSQRAESTLFHIILQQCSGIYMNPIKELHYFDTLYKVNDGIFLKSYSLWQLELEINKLVAAENFGFIDKRFKNLLRTAFLLGTKDTSSLEYIDLFKPCVQGNEILGEVTPEYMILPPEGISRMRETVGENARIVLLARNPVMRFISAFKLLMNGLPKSDATSFEADLLRTIASGGEWMRVQDAFNDYESAVGHYQKVFPNVLLLSYDELFGSVEATVEKLSGFLDVKISLEKYRGLIGTRVNVLSETGVLSSDTMTMLASRYSKQQAFLDEVFGKDRCCA